MSRRAARAAAKTAMAENARGIEMQALADEFELRLGMLEWALGVVRTWRGTPENRDAGLAEALSNGSHLDSAAAQRFIPRARQLLERG
jgi:hypothetical protein